MNDRPDPVEVGKAFVEERFPDCLCAFVSGSVLRGLATPTSDIDIVVIARDEETPFRATYRDQGWPIEVFVHTRDSVRDYLSDDGKSLSLGVLIPESVVVRDTDGIASRIQDEARAFRERGPRPLSKSMLENLRYLLTEMLDDFIDNARDDEGFLLAAEVAHRATELILRLNRQWIGYGKWELRHLREFDPALADRIADALSSYARTGDKEKLISFARHALDLAGGPLCEGFYRRVRPAPPPGSTPRQPGLSSTVRLTIGFFATPVRNAGQ